MIMTRNTLSQLLRPLTLVLMSALIMSCGTDRTEPASETMGTVRGDTVRLTSAQAASLQMTEAVADTMQIATPLRVNGIVHVPPQYAASLTAALGGTVRTINVLPGQRVRAGEALVVLEHRDFITLQQDYLTTSSTLQVMESELARQQRLAEDNVNARKVLEQTTADVRNLRVKRKALSEQLALIGIDASDLSERSLSRHVTLRAPFSGYVTQVAARTGAFVQPNDVLVDMVDTKHMHIELTVYERDARAIVEGQRLVATLINDPVTRGGHVHLVGREIGPDRTVTVHGHFDTVDTDIRPGTALTADIATTLHRRSPQRHRQLARGIVDLQRHVNAGHLRAPHRHAGRHRGRQDRTHRSLGSSTARPPCGRQRRQPPAWRDRQSGGGVANSE
jgi:membrane fusion protein, heavy metal efflux system